MKIKVVKSVQSDCKSSLGEDDRLKLVKSNSNLSVCTSYDKVVSEFSYTETLTPKRIYLKKEDDNEDENKNLKIINCSGRKKIFINKDRKADIKLIKKDNK